MKKYFYSVLSCLLIIVLQSCGNAAGSGGDKQNTLAQLKDQEQKIIAQIKKLEQETGAKDSTKGGAAGGGPSKEVSITPVSPKSFTHFITTEAQVQSDLNLNVVPQAQGIYKAVYVREGQKVGKGQALAKVDDLVLQRTLAQLQTQLELAKTIYDKRKKLWDQNIGTEIDYLTAKNNAENLQNQISTLRQQIAQTVVTAPVSGVVDLVNARLGEAASPSSPAFRVVNIDVLKVTAGLAENYLGRVHNGSPVILQFNDINMTLKTHVDFVGNSLDPNSRTFAVQTKLKHVKGIKPNMTATMKIQDYASNAAFVLPVDVVQNTLDGQYVYVAVPGTNASVVAHKKTVKVGLTESGQAQITTGLAAGDKVITTGYRGLEEGQNVKIGA